MSKHSGGWTLRTLKKYVDTRIGATDEAARSALGYAREATEKYEKQMTQRADASNEIRKAMLDQQAQYSTKEEMAALLKGLADRVDILEDEKEVRLTRFQTQTASSINLRSVVALLISGTFALVGVVTLGLRLFVT